MLEISGASLDKGKSLTEEEKEAIRSGIVKVEMGDTWSDDHIECISIDVQTGSGKDLSLWWWWCGPEGVAACRYANYCQKAQEDLLQMILSDMEGVGIE